MTVLLVLLASSVSATDLSVAVTVNGQPVRYINPAYEQLVDLTFTTDVHEGILALDLTALSQGLMHRFILGQDCTWNESENVCTLTRVPFHPASERMNISYDFQVGGQRIPGRITKSFILDTSRPVVTNIDAGVCDEHQCIIGSGLPANVTITLQDSTASFDKHLLFYRLGPTVFNIENCTDLTCKGRATVVCSDEQRLDLLVVEANGIPSQDDAGNPVEPSELRRVVCDAKAPRILNVTTNGTALLGLIADDGELRITALIDEAVSHVTMTAWTKEVQANVSENTTMSAQCKKTTNTEQRCTLAVPHLKAGRQLDVPLLFVDEVGNSVKARLTIPHILHMANASTRPDFFSARATTTTPSVINRVALQLALDNAIDYPHFINYEFTRHDAGAKILHQEMKPESCAEVLEPRSPGDAFQPNPEENWTSAQALYLQTRVFDPLADWNTQNRVDASFLKLDTSELQRDMILVRCNLSLVVEKDGVYYPTPEEETLYWPLKLRESKLGAPGEAFITKINEQRDYLEGGTMGLIGQANKLFSTFSQLCQLQDILSIINMYGLSVEGIGHLMMTGIGQSLIMQGKGMSGAMLQTSFALWAPHFFQRSGAEKAMQNADKKIQGGLAQANTKAGVSLRNFCDWVHCNTGQRINEEKSESNKWAVDNGLVTAGGKPKGGEMTDSSFIKPADSQNSVYGATLNRMTSNLNTPDVQNSLIMSLATKCWSGVVNNLNKWRLIECGYLACLKEQAAGGHGLAVCERTRGVAMCRQIMGEVFELPYVRVVKNLLSNINTVVQNPLLILRDKLQNEVCINAVYDDISLKGFGCRVMDALGYVKDFDYITETNGLFSYPYQADLCTKALCEGDECDRTTNSWLEGILNRGYTGDQWRRMKMAELREKADERVYGKDYEQLKKELEMWRKAPATGSDDLTSYPALAAYAKQNGLQVTINAHTYNKMKNGAKKGESAKAFYTKMLGGCTGDNCDEKIDEFIFDIEQGYGAQNSAELERNAKTGVTDATSAAYKVYNNLKKENKRVSKYITCTGSSCSSSCEDSSKLCARVNQFAKELTKTNTAADLIACGSGSDLKLYKSGKDCTDCSKGDCTTVDTTALTSEQEQVAEKENAKMFYTWIDQMLGIIFDKLQSEGKLDFLTLKGWGFGDFADTADKLLNSERWKQDICNPAGAFSDFTQDDGSVYAWESGAYRALLTFAAERLPIGERAEDGAGTTLYTISFVAVSPDDTNEVRVTLEPGGKTVNEEPVQLPKGVVTSQAWSLTNETVYEQVCIMFSKPFPDEQGETRFCRPIEPNAYDRGGVTNETIDFGAENPYEPVAYGTGVGNTGLGGFGAGNGFGVPGTGFGGGGR